QSLGFFPPPTNSHTAQAIPPTKPPATWPPTSPVSPQGSLPATAPAADPANTAIRSTTRRGLLISPNSAPAIAPTTPPARIPDGASIRPLWEKLRFHDEWPGALPLHTSVGALPASRNT